MKVETLNWKEDEEKRIEIYDTVIGSICKTIDTINKNVEHMTLTELDKSLQLLKGTAKSLEKYLTRREEKELLK